ncbi:hypothetical protein [uncultured Alistipes sp.]|jgi:hypothetical protein|uniref:hypothetical protein n=1 Tax=uncultured Alistipes sp. TaxID=538949 RepID=UPI0025E32E6A|nr:hypothetical protein [uncultured Alistipes sp.]
MEKTSLKATERRLRIKFGGDASQVDINTLVLALRAQEKIFKEISNHFPSDVPITIKVAPPRKGCFIIEIVVNVVEVYINQPDISDIVLKTLNYAMGINWLYDKFKGLGIKGRHRKESAAQELLKKDSQLNPQTADTIINIYNITSVRTAITKSICAASNDTAVTSLSIGTDQHESLKMDKEELDVMNKKFCSTITNDSLKPRQYYILESPMDSIEMDVTSKRPIDRGKKAKHKRAFDMGLLDEEDLDKLK